MRRLEQLQSPIHNIRIAPMEKAESQAMAKLDQIRSLLGRTPSLSRPKTSESPLFPREKSPTEVQRWSGHKVGIFCFGETDTGWLRAVLRSQNFSHQVTKMKFNAVKAKTKFAKEASKYTFCIFVFGKRSWEKLHKDTWSEDVKTLWASMPMMVVILDVEDNNEDKKRGILRHLSDIGIGNIHLFFFSEAEKYAYMQHLHPKSQRKLVTGDASAFNPEQKRKSRFPSFGKRKKDKRKKGYRPLLPEMDTPGQVRAITYPPYTQEKPSNEASSLGYPGTLTQEIRSSRTKPQECKRHIVGIFSRSSDDDYFWLFNLLRSEHFRDQIQEVMPCYISNNGFQQFMKDLTQCTFGILYHTKKRGRVNVTDVTDSLYDEELGYLNEILGKDNVVVLIDDLEENSDQEKTRILKNQPSIERLAKNLLLISHTEKADIMHLVRKLKRECFAERRQIQGTSVPSSTVAVFSISEEHHIDWLRRLLISNKFGNQHVTFHSISQYDYRGLVAKECQCKVAVIYHTMHSGGFPLTPHGESLYHKVLRLMSDKLGRDNVVMIIDDLQGHNYNMRKWVMSIRSGVEKLAGDLCPILQEDKETEMKLVEKLKTVGQFCNMSGNSHIGDLPQQATNTHPEKRSTSQRPVIGIFSVSEEGRVRWIRQLLSSHNFGQREVTYHKMSSYDNVGIGEGKLRCAVAIVYHTMNDGPPLTQQGGFLYHRVTDQMVRKLGRDNVIVLIDDLPHYGYGSWSQRLQSSFRNLLYIFEEEKHNEMQLIQKLKSLKPFHQPPDYLPKSNSVRPTSRPLNTKSATASSVVGIFSRSEQSKSIWLGRRLSSEEFGNHRVIFHQIDPTDSKSFQSMVSYCKFGILYHCMEQNKPLTDHVNSLYDKELEYLSSRIGKGRVIVVVDEMGNSNEEVKSCILNQPSLRILARDILLFSKSEVEHLDKPSRNTHDGRKLDRLKVILMEGMTPASTSSLDGTLI